MASETLAQALEPFAKAAEQMDYDAFPDRYVVHAAKNGNGGHIYTITAGDLRRARTAHDAMGSGVTARVDDSDEPQSFEELAEAAILDIRAYAYDEDPARLLVSVIAYEKRLKLLRACLSTHTATGAGPVGEAVAWRDMASARKNATEIILRIPSQGWPDHYAQIGHWAQDLSGEEQPPFRGWFRKTGNGCAELNEPTGWKPMPDAALIPEAPAREGNPEDDPRYPALLADAEARTRNENLDGSPRRHAVAKEYWQPIDTAPKDGTVIDLWHEDFGRQADFKWGHTEHSCGEAGRYCDSDWHSEEAGWVDTALNERFFTEDAFTHWRLLPSPPLDREEQ